jgi:hypothetical protein
VGQTGPVIHLEQHLNETPRASDEYDDEDDDDDDDDELDRAA